MVMLNLFQHLSAVKHSSIVIILARGEILKQVQDDIRRHLLFLLSFWGSQFNTSVYRSLVYSVAKSLLQLFHKAQAVHHIACVCALAQKIAVGILCLDGEIQLSALHRHQFRGGGNLAAKHGGAQMGAADF